MDEPAIPGAFPTAPEEADVSSTRTPRRRFVGRRTADAQSKQRHDADANSAVEDATAIVQKSRIQPQSERMKIRSLTS
jgi:hypothetical protein